MVTFTGTVTAPAEQVNVTVPPETLTLPVDVPERQEVGTTVERILVASVDVDLTKVKVLLRLAGWPEDRIDIGQAIVQAESACYSDAVGDLTLVTPLWGPSIGLFQIRSLRAPLAEYQSTDIWRHAWPLRRPFFNCEAALVLSKQATDFTLWSVFTSKSYEQYLGQDPTIRTGHAQAANWWK